jgi:pimeloyl-ACP methyl ester carboxylesterase
MPNVNTQITGRKIAVTNMHMYFEIQGEGQPLLLLHSFTGAGSDWKLIFNAFPLGFQCVIPDLRGHGQSTNPSGEFTHRQSALDVFDLLDGLGIGRFKAIGISTGAKTLLHMATQQPHRVEAMVLVSAAHYFPKQIRLLMEQFTTDRLTEREWQALRQRHAQGDEQIRMLYRQGRAFKDSYDDMNFTPPYLGTITARTLIVHGDRDAYYPVDIPIEMYKSIPDSSLWIIPNGDHAPIFGARAEIFAETAMDFLNK